MPRYTKMLVEGMKERGHAAEVLAPRPLFCKIRWFKKLQKWLGYIDQYIVFPAEVRAKLNNYSRDTLFVFTDHALGPWVPMVADRFHVIHCHDFLAQLSAIGEIRENHTGWTGRWYQAYIRSGFVKGKNFISVSENTQKDLHRFHPLSKYSSHVVHNGLTHVFKPLDKQTARSLFSHKVRLPLAEGYLLHIGGNQWYKNREGVIEIYDIWRSAYLLRLPLIMIGENPSYGLKERYEQSPFKSNIHFLAGIDDEFIRSAYAGASVLLFPSFAEGFGWPIVEAMACGCPVVTTNEAPMIEVAGRAAIFIQRRPVEPAEVKSWARKSAKLIQETLEMSTAEREAVIKAGLENAKRFDKEEAINKIEKIYISILGK